MWPFRKGWTAKQRKFRRDCREEEKEVERMINWMEMNVETVRRNKKAQERLPKAVSTEVANDPDAPKEGASTDPLGLLAGEFVSGTAASMDCCTEPRCPCHGVDNV